VAEPARGRHRALTRRHERLGNETRARTCVLAKNAPPDEIRLAPVTRLALAVSNLFMPNDAPPDALAEHAREAAAGNKAAARAVLEAIREDVYRLALRMLGHPADAEDAAQEILVIVVTHLGSFRGESSVKTWVWRIAANHLVRVKRGRREIASLDVLDDRLRTGLRLATPEPDPESEALASELRLRCTQAMLLGLDRELRLAYLLGDVFDLSGEEAAEILGIDHAAYRKRLSRARARLHDFLRGWCGVYDPANPCRCAVQVGPAVERGLLAPDDLYLSRHRARPTAAVLDRAAYEVKGFRRVAEMMRRHPEYLSPETLVQELRELLESNDIARLSE
jgi:RNA polymerase sigma factor (sigma-70 family)